MGKETHDTGGGHLDLLRIDAVRAGEGSAKEAAHLEACRLCRGVMHDLQQTDASLRGRIPPVEPVPPEMDEHIFREFRRAFAPRRRPAVFPAWRRWLVPALGTAAAAGLAVVLSLPLLQEEEAREDLLRPPLAVTPSAVPRAPAPPEDLNDDGVVDILDALRLARMLEERTPPPAESDLNGDGAVDRLDIGILARRAVAL